MLTLQSPTKTKAVKDHVCNFCGFIIGKGHTYMRSSHINDGVYTWKAHEYCNHLANRLNMYDDYDAGEGLTADHFQENIQDEYMSIMKSRHEEGYSIFKDHLSYVSFRHKLGTVIRHYKQSDKQQ